MTGINVSRINPRPTVAWQITTSTAPDLVTALAAAASIGYIGNVVCSPPSPNSPVGTGPNWQLTLTRAGYATQNAFVGDWVVFDGQLATAYTNDEFTSKFAPAAKSSVTQLGVVVDAESHGSLGQSSETQLDVVVSSDGDGAVQ